MTAYQAIGDLDATRAAREQLSQALSAAKLKGETVSLILVDSGLLIAFGRLADREVYMQPGDLQRWDKFQGFSISGKDGLGLTARFIGPDGNARDVDLGPAK